MKIGILATNGFEQSELESPKKALENEGWKVDVISPESGSIKGWKEDDWGDKVDVDKDLSSAKPEDYDALVLPGGVINPDQLRTHEEVLNFVKTFFATQKPVAAICHGPQILIDAQLVKDKKMTSVSNIKNDLINAGAHWVDEEVVVDAQLITSRTPQDLPAFNAKLIEMIQQSEY